MMNVATEKMNVVTERNFDRIYPGEVRRRYWEQVERSMSEVFDASPERAAERVGRYRELVEASPTPERILVYHQEPINVAADLAGVGTVTTEHQARYLKIYGGGEPSSPGRPDDD